VQQGSSRVAQHIAREIAAIGPYRLVTDGSDLPVFAFTVNPEVKNYTVFDVSARLREQGWLVPACTFPENRQDIRAEGGRQGRHVPRTWPTCSCVFRHGPAPQRSAPGDGGQCCGLAGWRGRSRPDGRRVLVTGSLFYRGPTRRSAEGLEPFSVVASRMWQD
jgi:hypothetical protein